MKLINALHKLKPRFPIKLPDNELYAKLIISIGLLTASFLTIWIAGPFIAWEDYAPLAQPEKRMYVILFFFFIWLLKFLLIDLDAPNPYQYKNLALRKRLINLQSRFNGAIQFLKKTTVSRYGKTTYLNQLPWYLIIGPTHAGKTTLLANSGVNFILQRQFQQNSAFETSENCDWWITRDASIIDVPGKYVSVQHTTDQAPIAPCPEAWLFFLRLIKTYRGKQGIKGITIALPFPELMLQNEPKKYQAMLQEIFHQIEELQKLFSSDIHYQIVITKCDLLKGFAEFFTDAGEDEITQPWGATIPDTTNKEKCLALFSDSFDLLIKKLNQQLIWRLHQERNPLARPYIKDFPLQVERIKELTLDFVKRLLVTIPNAQIKSIYLTSALQNEAQPEVTVLDEAINTTQRALQAFTPKVASRTYFVKQFIVQSFANPLPETTIETPVNPWKKRTAFATSIGIISLSAFLFGRDFEQGVKQTYAIQNNISNYQLTIQQIQNPNQHLIETVGLLNKLQKPTNKNFKIDLAYLLSFYTNKSQQKATILYHQALQTILIPQIKVYFEEYLKNPVNKNTEYLYVVLKSYLMLNNGDYFQPTFIITTLKDIIPKNAIDETTIDQLTIHLTTALNTDWKPQTLDENLIAQTRKYLLSIPSFRLGYIILKNTNNNYEEYDVNLGTNTGPNSLFVSRQLSQVPSMFSVQSFPTIIAQGLPMAAEQALRGNWILGNGLNRIPEPTTTLIEQLRNSYLNNYVDIWESLVANINLAPAKSLTQLDQQITSMISNDSPLLQLVQTVHDNTYFNPVAALSPKLQSLGALIDKNANSDNLLYRIFAGLQGLHQYIQLVTAAENPRKAAFDLIANRMKNPGTADAMTQMLLIADKSPEPIKNWLEKMANETLRFIMQEAVHYIDISWQEQVLRPYQNSIANRYPFTETAQQEVDLQRFTEFFGNPGIVVGFFNTYLQPFVDTSTPVWHWKTMDGIKLPFSEDTLQQVQQAMRINRSFFPNGDNKLYVQFALQPYKLGKDVRKIKLTINDKQIVDESEMKNPHVIIWPSNSNPKMTSLQLTLADQKTLSQNFPGDWGWFKLVNQSFESTITKKEVLLNLALNEYSAKYLLFIQHSSNPFFSTDLQHFQLSQQIINKQELTNA